MKVKNQNLQTIREEFNEYLLEDGNTLRAKQVLTIFVSTGEIKKDEQGKDLMKTLINFKLITTIIPTGDVDTTNLMEIGNTGITKENVVNKVKFEEKKSYLNLYETDEVLITIRGAVIAVWSTKYKDKNDIPVYYVEGKGAVDFQQKKVIAPIKEN